MPLRKVHELTFLWVWFAGATPDFSSQFALHGLRALDLDPMYRANGFAIGSRIFVLNAWGSQPAGQEGNLIHAGWTDADRGQSCPHNSQGEQLLAPIAATRTELQSVC